MSNSQGDSRRRFGEITRQTKETTISASILVDGSGAHKLNSGVPFFDHMLAQWACHSLMDINLHAEGDLDIDAHHTIEDCGITLGLALAEALGDRDGIQRFASNYAVLDESLSRAVIDIGSRAHLHFAIPFSQSKLGSMDCELFQEFFQGLCQHATICLHLECLYGQNNHHRIESAFKAFALTIRQAAAKDPKRLSSQPSTKGNVAVTGPR